MKTSTDERNYENNGKILQDRLHDKLDHDQMVLRVSVPGNTNLAAGDIVGLNIPSYESIDKATDRVYDVYLSGRYILTDVVHSISETGLDAKYTSYSVNKGESIAMCLREPDNSFIDMNTVHFVIIHELSHVMSESVGHTKEFWSNMKFLLEQAEKISIYKPVDYSKHPVKYCGMIINSSPYDFK